MNRFTDPQEEREPIPMRYSELPLAVREVISVTEFMWLGDNEKARLIQDLTEPDV